MNLTIERSDLLAALTRVAGIVPRTSSTEATTHVMLDASGGALTVRGTNMDMQATVSVTAVVTTPGALLVPGAQLLNLVKNLPDGADILMAPNDVRLSVKSGRSRFNLPTLPATSFPTFPDDDWISEFTIAGLTLADILTRTRWASAKPGDPSKASIAGVNIAVDEGRIRCTGTNTHVFEIIGADVGGEPATVASATIPSSLVNEFLALASDGGEATVSISQGKARMNVGETIIVGKLLSDPFPLSVTEFVGRVSSPPNTVAFGREQLRAAVRRVSSVSSDRLTGSVKFDVSLESAAVTTRGDNSDGADDVSAEASACGVLAFKAGYLDDALANMKGERVLCRFGDESKIPTVWSCAEDPDTLVILAGQRF